MKLEFKNVNTNKLHDELIAAGIKPILVEKDSDKTTITFHDMVEVNELQRVVDAHDPTPIPPQKTETELLKEQIHLQQELIDTLMFEILPTLLPEGEI